MAGTEQHDVSTQVLIAGAGPVGLALAIELGHRGISCVIVERNDRVGYSPRAKTTNVRSREHLRRWGIADALRRASPIPPDYPADVVFATRMNGWELARFTNAFNADPVRSELYSEEAQWVPQYILEEVMRQHIRSLPNIAIRFQAELTGYERHDRGVTGEIRDLQSGARCKARSAFLVGADGARSFVREAIGAKMVGSSREARNYSIIFRAPDLAARHMHGDAIMYWMVNNDVPAFLSPLDQHGLWSYMAARIPDEAGSSVDAVEMIRRGTGLHDLSIEIIRCDPWVAHSLVANFYSEGPVALAGDACHLHPPFGGFGMNMGIGDAVDLGWKIAAMLQGWGGPALLSTYEIERRPVHERTIKEALTNYSALGVDFVRPMLEEPGIDGDAVRREVGALIERTKLREFHSLGLVLGARYEASPIIVPDDTRPPPPQFVDYVPSAFPGCLAPHLWLADDSSLYDHFGAGFTLLVTDGDGEEAGPCVQAANERNTPLKVLCPGDPRLGRLYEARFALIRPDQHVAYRGDRLPGDVGSLLERVTGRAWRGTVAP